MSKQEQVQRSAEECRGEVRDHPGRDQEREHFRDVPAVRDCSDAVLSLEG